MAAPREASPGFGVTWKRDPALGRGAAYGSPVRSHVQGLVVWSHVQGLVAWSTDGPRTEPPCRATYRRALRGVSRRHA
ncbi:hypothetical protein GCM10018785_13040 [Streptomyces longispororuber]|uniref:Uncharacterized protein n=1 Tax=Streptomyces longispororuber TaxID=68230 RepID=A0A918ZBJ3_9ACTN|nr:hypothetical protein GCM10018785_13040 [Streptomyces longispororuber]